MKLYKSSQIRNFAILGHGSSGKTSLSESILKIGGKVTRLGTIENGSTVSDYHPGEKARKISIHSTPLHMEWKDKKFNMIDTPGYLDFVGESLAALAVVDMAIILVDINQGVEIGTENMWRHASQLKIPKLIVINGLDKENSNFEKTLEQIKKRFGSNVFPMQLPINPGPSYHQNIDILRSELISYKTDKSGDLTENKLPDEYKEQVDVFYHA